jgi:signal transduction histidine kinase
MIGAPMALGLYVAARRRLLVALRERAERAERERELLASQAIADERARLAAEIHDIVTHHVSLMVLRAGALEVESVDGATRRAAEELRVTGCRALDELRDLVRVLNDPPRPDRGTLEPVPDLSVLIDASKSAGVPVTAVSRGLARPVSPAVGRTVYRVVQEALTNVHRHAAGSRVDLALDYGANRVRVTVRNSAPALGASPALPSGTGTGLLGLERRIQLLEGTFRASPIDGGGFEVDAVLPAAVRSAP